MEYDELNFKYAPPSYDRFVPINNIQSITFVAIAYRGRSQKIDGERAGECILVFYLFSGDRLESTRLFKKNDYCKNKRKELMTLFKVQNQ